MSQTTWAQFYRLLQECPDVNKFIPFIVNLEKIDQDFTIITQQAMELLRFNGPLADCRSMRRQITPYTGASKITISQLMILINL